MLKVLLEEITDIYSCLWALHTFLLEGTKSFNVLCSSAMVSLRRTAHEEEYVTRATTVAHSMLLCTGVGAASVFAFLPQIPRTCIVCITTDIQGRHIRNCCYGITGCESRRVRESGERDKMLKRNTIPISVFSHKDLDLYGDNILGDWLCCANWFKFICKLVCWAPKMLLLPSTPIPFFSSLRNANLLEYYFMRIIYDCVTWRIFFFFFFFSR